MTGDELSERLRTATAELRKARVELHEERRWRSWMIGVLVGFSAFLAVVLLAPDWGLVSVANENRENGDLLVDCTTPGPRKPTVENPSTGHDCFDRGRATSAGLVEQIDVNQRCATQEAINQTLASLGSDLPAIQIINPAECFRE